MSKSRNHAYLVPFAVALLMLGTPVLYAVIEGPEPFVLAFIAFFGLIAVYSGRQWLRSSSPDFDPPKPLGRSDRSYLIAAVLALVVMTPLVAFMAIERNPSYSPHVGLLALTALYAWRRWRKSSRPL